MRRADDWVRSRGFLDSEPRRRLGSIARFLDFDPRRRLGSIARFLGRSQPYRRIGVATSG
jgi:hypothetical protein